MKIVIAIPDCFNAHYKHATIEIRGDEFTYVAPDDYYVGLQSKFSQVDRVKNDMLKERCRRIEAEVREMIKEELI